MPKHPTRRIFEAPPIYEFSEPVGGSYPIWYDPSYWYDGVVTHFSPRGHLRAVSSNVAALYEILFLNVSNVLLAGFLTLYLFSRRKWRLVLDLAPYSSLVIPALAGLAIYSIITVELRYVAPFVMLLWLALFSALRLPNNQEARRLISCVISILMALMVITVTASSNHEAYLTLRSLTSGEDFSAHEQSEVANGLRQMGVRAGEKVAFFGESAQAYWAHLASVRIVAEVEEQNVGMFWAADETLKSQIFETLNRTGAKVIITRNPPLQSDPGGWKRIGNTSYYCYLLSG
jgi:hypothetical protein